MRGALDVGAFTALQGRLAGMWPSMTIRERHEERTLVVLSSIDLNPLPAHILPLVPAYEERYLFYVLALARAPRTRVVYVTSQPVLPRLLDYYLGLVRGIDRADLQRRVVLVSVGDWSPRPLAEKVLERPRLLARLRSLIADPYRAVLLPFMTTELEAQLALELGIPVYGPDPRLAVLGTKSGSRRVFAAAGVPHPRGREELRTVADVVGAVEALAGPDGPAEAVVKLDGLASGLGNALVDLGGAHGRRQLERRIRALRPEDDSLGVDAFLELLGREGGIVEERIAGPDLRSPSVQLRASPFGEVEVLTTHDQVLGGSTGQTYQGCRFPADPAYAALITTHATAVGAELARRGVIGRFGIDFVVTRGPRGWNAYAIEINLRNGGTTHPALALLALTNGDYDAKRACFLVAGTPKHYVATDHLRVGGLESFTPDDMLDLIAESGLAWDDRSGTGLVFHLISGVAVAGLVGVTAIADSPHGADALYRKVEATLAGAATTSSPSRTHLG